MKIIAADLRAFPVFLRLPVLALCALLAAGPAALADTAFVASIGHCLNKAVNEAADMLFGFYKAEIRACGKGPGPIRISPERR